MYKNSSGDVVDAIILDTKTTASHVFEWCKNLGDNPSKIFVPHAVGICLRGENGKSITAHTLILDSTKKYVQGDVIIRKVSGKDTEYSIVSQPDFKKEYSLVEENKTDSAEEKESVSEEELTEESLQAGIDQAQKKVNNASKAYKKNKSAANETALTEAKKELEAAEKAYDEFIQS